MLICVLAPAALVTTVCFGRWGSTTLTSDPGVAAGLVEVTPTLAIYVFFDAVLAFMNGVLVGCGQQVAGGTAALACYGLVSLPLSLTLGFSPLLRPLGIRPIAGLLIGQLVGKLAHTLWTCRLVAHINWAAESAAAARRIRAVRGPGGVVAAAAERPTDAESRSLLSPPPQ